MLRSIVLSSAFRRWLKPVAFIVAPVILLSAGIGSVKPRSGTYGVLSGRVLDAEERTIAGATVFVTEEPKLQKTTDDKGRFHFSEAETTRLLDKAAVDKPLAGLDVVAVADGFGLDWINVRTYATTSTKDDLDPADARNITLRLVKDAPIRGRLVNSEGDPLDGIDPSWIYRKIGRGSIRIKKDTVYDCYLFPRTKHFVNQAVVGQDARLCGSTPRNAHVRGVVLTCVVNSGFTEYLPGVWPLKNSETRGFVLDESEDPAGKSAGGQRSEAGGILQIQARARRPVHDQRLRSPEY